MKRLGPPLLIALVALLLFSPVLRHDFTNLDDPQTIAENAALRPPTLASLAQLWSAPAAGLYVPITYSLWWLVSFIGLHDGVMRAWPFHLLSVALHAGCGLLIWSILRRLRYSLSASLIGGLLFIVHPVQVESVAWASGAKDLLAAFFVLAAINSYTLCLVLGGVGGGEGPSANDPRDSSMPDFQAAPHPDSLPRRPEGEATGTPPADPRPGIAWISIVLMTLAMLSKPSAIVAPLILAVIDRFYANRSFRCSLRRLWPVLLVMLPVLIVARAVQTITPAVITPLWTRPLIAGDALAFYLAHLAWPATLTHLYGRTPMLVTASPALYAAWLLPAIAGLFVLALARRFPGVAAGAVVFLIGLLPVLGLTPFEFQIHSTVADHYLYLPMLGVALSAAAVVDGWRRGVGRELSSAEKAAQPPAARAFSKPVLVSSLLLLALALRAGFALPIWQNSITLNAHAVAVRPRSVDAHGSLAIALAEAGRLDQAVPELQFVVEQSPNSRLAHLRLAQAYLGLHRFDAALPQALAAVQLTSLSDRDPWPEILLSDALAGVGQRDRAIQALEIAQRIDSQNAAAAARLEVLQAAATQP